MPSLAAIPGGGGSDENSNYAALLFYNRRFTRADYDNLIN